MNEPVRIAVWSGPRNISTAMMRAWEARGDAAVVDEPLYAHYLATTGLDHPGAEAVVQANECDWRKVVAVLLGPVPGGRSVFYQKHMAHHLLPEIELEWIGALRNALLIRDPRAMVRSLSRVIPNPTIDETGLPQQERLDRWLQDEHGVTPPVLDAHDTLRDPASALRALCEALGVAYTPRMLSWPPGRRETDGVWAEHWYANVMRSIGFSLPSPRAEDPPRRLLPLVRQCERIYERLAERRLASA